MEIIAETMSGLKGEESGGSYPTVRMAVLEFDGSTRTIINLDGSDSNALPVSKKTTSSTSTTWFVSATAAHARPSSSHPRSGADRKIIVYSNKVDNVSNPYTIASEYTDLLHVEGTDVIMVSAELQTCANFASAANYFLALTNWDPERSLSSTRLTTWSSRRLS